MPDFEKIKTILSRPNSLTIFRMAASPVIVLLFLYPNRFLAFIGALFFSAAAITDYFDGYLARRQGLESNFGKIMDPLADKLLVSASFIMLVSVQWIPGWIVCFIIGRELFVTALRNFLAQSGEDVSASNLGKYKTGFQISAIIPLMIHYEYLGIDFNVIGYFFLYGALVFTIWSGADYFFRYKGLLKP